MPTPPSPPSPAASALLSDPARRPIVGMLWGDFPWSSPARPLGGLLSAGIVARTLSHALAQVSTLRPFHAPPRSAEPSIRQAALVGFLRSIDVLFADCAAGSWSGRVLALRHELRLPCRALIYMDGALPQGAEPLLSSWRDLLRPDDALLFTCQAGQAIWRRLVRESALQEWVIPLAADETLFFPRPTHERVAIRRSFGLPVEVPILLYVGRLNVQKNLHTLLRLLVAVRESVSDAQICLVGDEDELGLDAFGVRNTGYGAWVRQQAEVFGVGAAVTFVPSMKATDLARLYRAADVLVHAGIAQEENFGLVLAEAQLCGLPVVCSAWGGFKDVVRPGQTGEWMAAVLTKQGVRVDWATGARAVVALLQDTVRRDRIGQQAAAWAHEQFTIDALAHRLGQVLRATASSTGASTASSRYSKSASMRPAVTPSPLARRYATRKRVCGWEESLAQRDANWYPPLFEGDAYRLYEAVMGPYATCLATDLAPSAIQPDWIPFVACEVTRDPVRRLLRGLDPIWPYSRYLTPVEWDVFTSIDGKTTVRMLVTQVLAGKLHAPDCNIALWRLRLDGFILFDRGAMPFGALEGPETDSSVSASS